MTIKKFQGKTEAEATEKAKKELGDGCVIMNVKEVKPKGMLSFMKSVTYEVTAAVEEKEKNYDPSVAFKTVQRAKSINVVADEKINITPVPKQDSVPEAPKKSSAIEMFSRTPLKTAEDEDFEKKVSNLQTIINKEIEEKKVEEKVVVQPSESAPEKTKRKSENFGFIKTAYEVLIENEVDEKYVNQIMDELEKAKWGGNSVDAILSAVYQKLILKFGQPHVIELKSKPKVVFFIGPTGVGKTTTIAKIASKYKMDYGKSVAFITADTYRIAASEQLKTYANILVAPMSIVYTPGELNEAVEQFKDTDLILVDTAGLSHKNEEQKANVKALIESLDAKYEKDVYLVLSSTTKYKDLLDIADTYKEVTDYNLIFTKLDETSCYGNLLNVHLHTGAALSYATNGQNVPDDLEVFDTQKIVKQLLGGR